MGAQRRKNRVFGGVGGTAGEYQKSKLTPLLVKLFKYRPVRKSTERRMSRNRKPVQAQRGWELFSSVRRNNMLKTNDGHGGGGDGKKKGGQKKNPARPRVTRYRRYSKKLVNGPINRQGERSKGW